MPATAPKADIGDAGAGTFWKEPLIKAMGMVDQEFGNDDTLPTVKDIENLLRQVAENCSEQAKSAVLLQV